MTSVSLRISLLVLGLGAVGLFCGCASTLVEPGGGPRPAKDISSAVIPTSKVNAVENGMTAGQILDLLGQPDSKKKVEAGLYTEVWTYRVSYIEAIQQLPVNYLEVASTDAMGRNVTIRQPVYQLQTTRVYRTLELVIVNGRLQEQKRGKEVERRFD